MNRSIITLAIVGLTLLSAGGCAYPLLDNVTLSNTASSSDQIDVPGKEVEGTTYYPYLIGYNIRDAVDDAFENAGPEYDLIVNAKITVKYYYLLIYYSKYVIVNGTAVNSKELIAQWGDEKYRQWLGSQNVLHHSNLIE